jgi:CRP-like cAMP-binding protein
MLELQLQPVVSEQAVGGPAVGAPAVRPARSGALPAAFAASLSPEERTAIEALNPAIKRLQVGQCLYEQGDHSDFVYLLIDGWAFRYRTLNDGRRQIVDFALPGALLGFGPGRLLTHGVEARTVCDLCVIPRARFDELLLRVPALAFRLIQTLAQNEAIALERLMTIGRQSARERIAHLLVELVARARQAGLRVTDKGFTLPLTQTHIADATGLTSVHVCRTLAELRKDGVVLLRTGKLQILDIRQLIAEAGFASDDPMPWAGPAANGDARAPGAAAGPALFLQPFVAPRLHRTQPPFPGAALAS